MARMSGVPFLGIADNGLITRQDIVVVHTIVGYQAGGNAAHWTTGASGRIVQARDTIYCSAANLNGNWHTLAIENEDHGPAYGSWSGSDVPPFTAAQCEAVAKILAWCHQVHAIPLELVRDSKVGRRGVAFHRQGIDPGRVTGGELWSSSYGKVCPGDNRIRQLANQIIPRARVLAGLEDDMATPAEVWSYENGDEPDMHQQLKDARAAAQSAQAIATENQREIRALAAKVDQLLARP
jgi:N-acetylmuramoyl-L-alanine amidase-like protein